MKCGVSTVGDRFGSWTIEDLVSLGIPRTYRVRHVTLGTPALLKVTPWSEQTEAGQAREVEALKHLTHTGVCEVLGFGHDRERNLLWTAFAWFDGDSLLDQLQGGALPWTDVCRIFRQVGATLADVHAAGIVHRDLRPSHVLVTADGATRLVGFDFAMTRAQLDPLVQVPFGDLGYLAPEVLRDPVHHGTRADTYALGCVMYELLTGRAPFPAAARGSRPDAASRMLDWKTRSTALDPGEECPNWLRSLVGKATHPDPEQRLPDLDAFVGWLDAARPSWQPSSDSGFDDTPKTELYVKSGPPIVVAPPSIRPLVPSIAPMPARPAPTYPAIPLPAQYFAAATLGGLCALGFSSILILFVELRAGAL